MSWYTVGEIVVWLVLAAMLGFVLGWLTRSVVTRASSPDPRLDDSRPDDVQPDEMLPASAEVVAHTEPVSSEPVSSESGPEPSEDDTADVVTPGPFARSALPGPDGEAPGPDWTVKGKRSSMIYHAPTSRSYARTVAEVWFRTVDDAQAAGFREPKR